MKVVCAWCNKTLSPGLPGDEVSHGICPECRHGIYVRRKLGLDELLDGFDVPVIAFAANGRPLHTNGAAAKIAGTRARLIEAHPAGSAVESAEVHPLNGYERPINGSSRAIGDAITATFRDGRPRRGVEGEKLVRDSEGVNLVRFAISTEKTGGIVVLVIDDLKMLAADVVPASSSGRGPAG